MTIEITVLVSTLAAVSGMVLGVISARRSTQADIARQSRETATIISEIGYVKAGIDDIKRVQEKQDERHYSLMARVTKLEASMATHIMYRRDYERRTYMGIYRPTAGYSGAYVMGHRYGSKEEQHRKQVYSYFIDVLCMDCGDTSSDEYQTGSG